MVTYAFIDAANLFYGGEKSLEWKIDYEKLAQYLKDKYQVSRILYFGGVEIQDFQYDYLEYGTVPLVELEQYLSKLIKKYQDMRVADKAIFIDKSIKRVRFYRKLELFGYQLFLKPVKFYTQEDGVIKSKANCDVEMAFYIMKEKEVFDRALVLSGDGDFLPLLKYMQKSGKEVLILARGLKTAKEIKKFAGSNFRDFVRLQQLIELKEDK